MKAVSRFNRKQKLLALGSYPLLSLSEARHVRDEAKRILISDVDPAHDRKLNKAAAERYTFRSIAEEYVDKLKKEGRADTTIIKINWLLDFAYPTMGHKCVRDIDAMMADHLDQLKDGERELGSVCISPD